MLAVLRYTIYILCRYYIPIYNKFNFNNYYQIRKTILRDFDYLTFFRILMRILNKTFLYKYLSSRWNV